MAAIISENSLDRVLEKMIGPFSSETFRQEYWGKQHKHIVRDDAKYFSNLFSFQSLDRLIGLSTTNEDMFFGKDGILVSAEDILGANRNTLPGFFSQFSAGLPIVIKKMEHRWPAIGRLVNEMSREFGFEVSIELAAFPPSCTEKLEHQGHSFIFQVDGESLWNADHAKFPLSSGDTLYLSGCKMSRAWSLENASLILIAKVTVKTMKDLFNFAIAKEAESNLELRRTLPLGVPLSPQKNLQHTEYFTPLVPEIMDRLDVSHGHQELSFLHKSKVLPLPDSHFCQMRMVDGISAETILERRPGVIAEMKMMEDEVEFAFPGNNLVGPDKLFLAMDFLKNVGRFRYPDIPGWYSDNEKKILAKKLVRKGYLRIVTDESLER